MKKLIITLVALQVVAVLLFGAGALGAIGAIFKPDIAKATYCTPYTPQYCPPTTTSPPPTTSTTSTTKPPAGDPVPTTSTTTTTQPPADEPVVTTTTTEAPAPTTTTTAPPATTQPPLPGPVGVPVTAPPSYTVPPCQEDEPCWDCATMGNLQCGVTTTDTVVDTITPPTAAPAETAVTLPETL